MNTYVEHCKRFSVEEPHKMKQPMPTLSSLPRSEKKQRSAVCVCGNIMTPLWDSERRMCIKQAASSGLSPSFHPPEVVEDVCRSEACGGARAEEHRVLHTPLTNNLTPLYPRKGS